MPSPIVSAKQFLEALYAGVESGFIEIRPLLDDDDPRKLKPEGRKLQAQMRKWFRWPDGVLNCVKYVSGLNGGDFHLYFGVALRNKNGGGTKADIACCTAVFADIDFKDIDPEDARKLLAEFPFKPSIIIKSGNGLHVYWLLMEAVEPKDFPKLEAVNRGMLLYMKAQIGPQDASRILRLPGTLNIKKKYPNPKPITTVTWFHPENRYILDDFEQYLPKEDPKKVYVLKPQGPGQPGVAPGNALQRPQDAPSFVFQDETLDEVAHLLAKAWIDGQRHYVALHVAGFCAHLGYAPSEAERLITHICDITKDVDVADRLTAVRDSYSKFMGGQKVAGFTSLESMIKASLPELVAHPVVMALNMVKRALPSLKKNSQSKRSGPQAPSETLPQAGGGNDTPAEATVVGAEPAHGGNGHGGHRDGAGRPPNAPNFHLIKAIKFKSSPPRYQVLFEKDGTEHMGACEAGQFLDFKAFKALIFQQTDVVLSHTSAARWDTLLGEIRWEHREAPIESSPEGAIDEALHEFLQEGKESPDLGLLKSFPGYDDTTTFFKYEAFKDFLLKRKAKFTDPQVYDRLRSMGWENKTRRFGRKTPKVWYINTPEGGSGPGGNGNGHPPEDAPKPMTPPPTLHPPATPPGDLDFPEPGSDLDVTSTEASGMADEASVKDSAVAAMTKDRAPGATPDPADQIPEPGGGSPEDPTEGASGVEEDF